MQQLQLLTIYLHILISNWDNFALSPHMLERKLAQHYTQMEYCAVASDWRSKSQLRWLLYIVKSSVKGRQFQRTKTLGVHCTDTIPFSVDSEITNVHLSSRGGTWTTWQGKPGYISFHQKQLTQSIPNKQEAWHMGSFEIFVILHLKFSTMHKINMLFMISIYRCIEDLAKPMENTDVTVSSLDKIPTTFKETQLVAFPVDIILKKTYSIRPY